MRLVALFLAAVLMVGCTAGQKSPEAKPNPSTTPPAQEQPKPEQPKPEQPKPEQPKPEQPKPQPAKKPTTPAEVEQALGARAREVVNILKARDMARLAPLVHPDKGVRFTPYERVDKEKDLVFKGGELQGAWVNKRLYLWGHFDGTGDPINLGFRDYFEKFVYDVDFANAPHIGWNESIGRGNSINNWREAYPEGVMVEFHFAGFEKQYGGMDWRSLRLVFEQKGEHWYLVGIIHGQWTI